MPRPPIKKTRVLAQAEEEGRLKARRKDKLKDAKFDLKGLLRSAAIGFKDRVKDDPFRFLCVLGVTYVVKEGIEWAEILATPPRWFEPFIQITNPGWTREDALEKLDEPHYEALQWFLAFCLAYLIVENFGAIYSATIGAVVSIIDLAKGLLGVLALV